MSNLDPPALSITERAAAIQKAIAEIVKLRAKQAVSNTLYYRNGPNTTLVYNLPLNSKVLIQQESSNWTGPYRLLAVEDETYYIQLPSGPISFRSTSVKPYFQPKTAYNAKLDELKVTAELNELETPTKLDELEVPAKLDKLEVPLPTLEVLQKPTKPAKPTIKRGRGRPRKNPIIENYLTSIDTSADISVKQPPPIDILVLVQETSFTDL